MNSKVENLIKDLKVEFANDVGYSKYKELEIKVKENKELYSKILEFKKLRMIDALEENASNPIDTNTKINILYTEIFFNEIGREYLILEKIIGDELENIMAEICSGFDFDLNSLR